MSKAYLVIIQLLKRIKYYSYIDVKKHIYVLIPPLIFGVILIISITESTFQRLSVANLVFIFMGFMILKTSESIKNKINE